MPQAFWDSSDPEFGRVAEAKAIFLLRCIPERATNHKHIVLMLGIIYS